MSTAAKPIHLTIRTALETQEIVAKPRPTDPPHMPGAWLAHAVYYLEEELKHRREGPEPHLHVWVRKGVDKRRRPIVVCRRCGAPWKGVGANRTECQSWEERFGRFVESRALAGAGK